MGIIDTEGKAYFSNKKFLADAFNFLLYDGEEIIQAEKLEELDTTQIATPYGNGARVPVQKSRDILKLWNAMMDDNAIYVILGAELQAKVHYGMPVKDGLYDMLGYAKQIEEARQSYKTKKDISSEGASDDNEKEGNLFVQDGTLKIKLTSEEFLSGFRKGDKLIPIITAVIYVSDEPWDGPTSLFEMLDVKDKRLIPFLNEYKINLIAPYNINDSDFDKFNTDLGIAMKVFKHLKDGADKVIEETNHKLIDRSTAVFLNRVAKLELEIDETEEAIDMCVAMENRMKKERILSAIESYEELDMSRDEIIARIKKRFEVTEDYIKEIQSEQLVK